MSAVNKTRLLVQHESCECKCGLIEGVCNSKKKKKKKNGNIMNVCVMCGCKELGDWSSCEKCYVWNPSTCNCECNMSCKIMNI